MAYQLVKSVSKAMAILELLMDQALENKHLTLAEVAARTGILPVTARNLLRTLEECGYVRRSGHGKYEEGDKCCRLFRAEGILRRLREVAAPLIDKTVEDLGESVLLSSIVKGRRVEILRRQAAGDGMVEPHWAANANFYRMRTTRVVLAWFSLEQLNNFIEVNGLPQQGDWPECGNTFEGLKQELLRIRHAGGCAEEHGSFVAIAAPILTGGNEVVAALGCYAPLSRTDKPRRAGILSMLHDCARHIEEKLGQT